MMSFLCQLRRSRTMMMSLYGDMDISKMDHKPSVRKNIITLSKPEKLMSFGPTLKKYKSTKPDILGMSLNRGVSIP